MFIFRISVCLQNEINAFTFVVYTIVMKLEDELKMKAFESPYSRALLNIMFTGNWVSDRANATLKPFGISEQQYNVLRILQGQKGAPISMSSIQERMIHRMSNATRLVEKLRLKGCVEREICPTNRRQVDILITPAGQELLEQATAAMKNVHGNFSNQLTTEEATMLADLLDKVRE